MGLNPERVKPKTYKLSACLALGIKTDRARVGFFSHIIDDWSVGIDEWLENAEVKYNRATFTASD